jgi:hypothetical protein
MQPGDPIMSSADETAADRRRRIRARRARVRNKHHTLAEQGVHLPSLPELIAGSPWLSRSLEADAKAWAERVLPRIDRTTGLGAAAAGALAALTTDAPVLNDFISALDAFRNACDPMLATAIPKRGKPVPQGYRGPDADRCAMRCAFYAASLGSSEACLQIAQHAVDLAQRMDARDDDSARFAQAALGWLATAQHAAPMRTVGMRGRSSTGRFVGARHDAEDCGEALTEMIVIRNAMAAEDEAASAQQAVAVLVATVEADQTTPGEPSGVVVIPEVGSPGTPEGKRISELYKKAIGVHLPLPAVPDLAGVRETLAADFPHAGQVIEAILRNMDGTDHVRILPTILVGEPGCGKTTFATRLMKLLGIGHQVYPCGGVADSNLAGTPRQWATGAASVPISLAVRHRTAAPGIILDEVEKVATSRHNGSLLDSLLAMLEPVSACRWLDPHLQTECDLSHVIWIGTANSVDGIQAPLRDRRRVVRFPSPGPEHLAALAPALISAAVEEQGLDGAWALPLDGVELEALRRAWPGGSIRALRRLVDVVLTARDRETARA